MGPLQFATILVRRALISRHPLLFVHYAPQDAKPVLQGVTVKLVKVLIS